MDKKRLCIEDIDLIVYDFDGVMTNNKVLVDQSGRESVVVNRSDGLAVSAIRKMKIKQIILSTEENPVVKSRADKLKIPCIQSVENKKKALEKYIRRIGVDRKRVLYIGNDINDLEVIAYTGYTIAPSDAYPDVRKKAKIITKAKGGEGVVRELLDMLL
ncbi:MAG: 3-deoxy-D-manno-octulosonate 8-phosphate phosphatase (KDO 8-P phosphatase) [Desulfobacteraceae bacterium Eth-SRB1]|nr:MAG: 3-deoxy-D-manno-octulosonate 8-phosphate phosphatase (KDO 8-P phosphatase) [Desulfobacteraceae bacterium Eth-SRB1]